MKKLYTLFVLLLLSAAAFAQDGKSIYQKYSDSAEQAVYISPAMFRLIGKIPDVQLGDEAVNLAPIIKNLSGFYLITTSRADLVKNLRDDVDKSVKKGRYELLMEAKESGEVVHIYSSGGEEIIDSIIMFVHDGDETTFLTVDGTIRRADLEALIASAAQ